MGWIEIEVKAAIRHGFFSFFLSARCILKIQMNMTKLFGVLKYPDGQYDRKSVFV